MTDLLAEIRTTEDWETVWLPGHVQDRNERRRMVEEIFAGQLDLDFMDAVRWADTAQYRWMCQDPERESGWSVECDPSHPEATPMTRLDAPP